ncbi:hypothetical protein MBEHAL_0565 [Halarchaeum acidiphilum MH1-52-1]|uniref:Uncharacterized protein n=1 Tax=Halarchaeum acidiphilum MH1-52-1 TaxID=1261545 RepID=U2YS52_9EURY|nr:hypothetical protein [Halarchaeum acidiphilum]GAD51805.1 hypothetical protein MBEHAL_0565 [Halarchaeum acidiphilum MH1-52-1]
MPVPTYPSDEPDRRGGAPDLDDLVGRIIRGNDERERAPAPTCGP